MNYFQQALEGNGKVYASNSIMTYTMTQADDFVITPSIYDDTYIDFLLNFCKKEAISVIVSCFDIDLPVLAANKKRFLENGIDVIVSDLSVTKICNDKWLTYKKLEELGIGTPHTFLNLEEVECKLLSKELTYPLILKPRWGMGSIGIYKAENEEELKVLYKKLKREIFSTYLRFESEEDKEHCIVIQEMLYAQEYGLDVLNDLNGNFVTVIAKKKKAMRAGETDIAEIVPNTQFLEVGKKLSAGMKHIANLDVDCFIDDNGKLYILEMNCRFGGQYPFSHIAGVDFPRQIVEWLSGNGTKQELITPTIGVESCKDLTPVIIKK